MDKVKANNRSVYGSVPRPAASDSNRRSVEETFDWGSFFQPHLWYLTIQCTNPGFFASVVLEIPSREAAEGSSSARESGERDQTRARAPKARHSLSFPR